MNELLDIDQVQYRHFRLFENPYNKYGLYATHGNGYYGILQDKGGITVASYYDAPTGNTHYGIALCSIEDYFNKTSGRYVSLEYLKQGVAAGRIMSSSKRIARRNMAMLRNVAEYVGEPTLRNHIENS